MRRRPGRRLRTDRDAFEAGLAESTAPADPDTVAFGITVPKALGDFLVLDPCGRPVGRRSR